jgi:ABC-type uncharacterized transport system permease subunit
MPSTGQIILVVLAIAIYVIGGGISLSRMWRDRPGSRIAAKACMYSGVCLSLAVLVWRAISRASWVPLEDNFDVLLWLAVILSLFVLYVQRRKPIGGLDWFVMPIVILLLIAALIVGQTQQREYVRNAWTYVHFISSFGGAAAFAVAGAAGAMYLIANYRLRNKVALSGPNLGNLERLEHLTLTAVTLGFALLTIGAITGFIKIKFEHRHAPLAKVVLSVSVWVVYALVLHSPLNPSFRGRRAAVLSIVGFVLMLGVIVAVLLMPSSSPTH